VFKLKFTLCFALVAGILTIIVSILKDIRILTTLYRMLVSSVIFGIIGYILGYITENFLIVLVAKLKPKRQNIDIASGKETEDSLTQPVSNHFNPFNKDDFKHIS
jgi:hypothetical protein